MKEKYILCGLYDKNNKPHEQNQLKEGKIPVTTKKYNLVTNDIFSQVTIKRKEFPFRKFNGTEQVYYGWYILIPKGLNILSLNENQSIILDHSKMKLENIENKGIEYEVYGKFNIAKTSDNWSLTIIIE